MIRLSDAATLFHADCRDAIRSLPSNSVDSIVTDPPYELNFMGKGWDDTGIANDPALWAEVFRVLKPGGHLAAFSASRTYHRMACAIEDAGFEIRDSLMWIYGTGFPKGLNVSKAIDKHLGAVRTKIPATGGLTSNRNLNDDGWSKIGDENALMDSDDPVTPEAAEWSGWNLALKPAFEPIVLARKPLSEPTVAANVLKWRTGALNIGASRVPTAPGESTKRIQGEAEIGFHGGNYAPGLATGSDSGRWPANVVTDGSDEVVGMFPQSSTTGKRSDKSKSAEVAGTNWLTNNHKSVEHTDSGSAARFFYSAKASKADRNGSKHPTVKPISLMEWLTTLVTPPGGTILDPFAGSGTTGIAATRRGFQVILCERESEYVADIKARFGSSPHLVIDLERVRQEILIEREIAAFQKRLAARA